MVEVQKAYVEVKNVYDTAFKNEDWAVVDAVEDQLLDAEEALTEWLFDQVKGAMKADEIKTLKENHHLPQFNEKIIDLALRYEA